MAACSQTTRVHGTPTVQTPGVERTLILATRSPARAGIAAALAAEIGAELVVRASGLDERAFEAAFDPLDPAALALTLAEAKATSVAEALAAGLGPPTSPPRSLVVGADQLLVVDGAAGPELLHQPGSVEAAVAQLGRIVGTTHRLVNGVCVLDPVTGDRHQLGDVQQVTMRPVSASEVRAYVETHRPLDCVGAYRLEDDAGFVTAVVGEHASGVLGLPLPALGRLLGAAGWGDAPSVASALSQSSRWSTGTPA